MGMNWSLKLFSTARFCEIMESNATVWLNNLVYDSLNGVKELDEKRLACHSHTNPVDSCTILKKLGRLRRSADRLTLVQLM